MTLPFQIRARVQELRREIAEIKAADNVGHHSGVEKLKHEKRIDRLHEIQDELWAMIAKHGVVSLLTLSVNQTPNSN